MKCARVDIGSLRREQIVEAAVACITERGLQNLSLSEIENRAGMSRGQLMYYFPTKEEILLAVFDRLLLLLYERIGEPESVDGGSGPFLANLERLFRRVLSQPPISPEFNTLQYTFLAQIGHRADFRERLARLYAEWRTRLGEDLERVLANQGRRPVAPRALASLIQALFQGLAIQRAADPAAYDPDEMVKLCLDIVSRYLRTPASRRRVRVRKPRALARNAAKERSNGHAR
jgi:AcrR family transcriptional regulator